MGALCYLGVSLAVRSVSRHVGERTSSEEGCCAGEAGAPGIGGFSTWSWWLSKDNFGELVCRTKKQNRKKNYMLSCVHRMYEIIVLPFSTSATAVPQFYGNVGSKQQLPPELELSTIIDPVWEQSSKQKGGGLDKSSTRAG